jgi:hypothetical protein
MKFLDVLQSCVLFACVVALELQKKNCFNTQLLSL